MISKPKKCVLIRSVDGHFVVMPGTPRKYTDNLKDAYVFRSQLEAEQDKQPGERIWVVEY